jgi:hypothetical protein
MMSRRLVALSRAMRGTSRGVGCTLLQKHSTSGLCWQAGGGPARPTWAGSSSTRCNEGSSSAGRGYAFRVRSASQPVGGLPGKPCPA